MYRRRGTDSRTRTGREETLASGASRALDARTPIEVTVGNLPGLRIGVIGRPLPLPDLPATARIRFAVVGSD
ncbi:MAG: RodZ domain-containing protein [Actinomycetota bacterium]